MTFTNAGAFVDSSTFVAAGYTLDKCLLTWYDGDVSGRSKKYQIDDIFASNVQPKVKNDPNLGADIDLFSFTKNDVRACTGTAYAYLHYDYFINTNDQGGCGYYSGRWVTGFETFGWGLTWCHDCANNLNCNARKQLSDSIKSVKNQAFRPYGKVGFISSSKGGSLANCRSHDLPAQLGLSVGYTSSPKLQTNTLPDTDFSKTTAFTLSAGSLTATAIPNTYGSSCARYALMFLPHNGNYQFPQDQLYIVGNQALEYIYGPYWNHDSCDNMQYFFNVQ